MDILQHSYENFLDAYLKYAKDNNVPIATVAKNLRDLNQKFSEICRDSRGVAPAYIERAGQSTLFPDPNVPGLSHSYVESKILYDR